MKVKQFLVVAVLTLSLGLSGCNALFPTGSSGKVYLKLSKDSTASVYSNYYSLWETMSVKCGYLYFNELPNTIYWDESYEISSGTGTYDGSYTMYTTDGHYYYFYDYGPKTSSTYGKFVYASSIPDGYYSFDFSYTVTANKGSSGFLKGKNGEDAYYTFYLAFNPQDYSLAKSVSAGGKSVSLPSTTSVDASSGKITKVFTDTDYTITVIATPNADKAGTPLSDIKPVQK